MALAVEVYEAMPRTHEKEIEEVEFYFAESALTWR